ncbi:MAG: hypothetical protein JW795_23800 [Chitinivibrionales bacterium]|nr:hypothetical protein [Chitinivibrionales bacterium]
MTRAECVQKLLQTKKYRFISPDTLGRIAEKACVGSGEDKDDLKRAKRMLHQIYAAFITPDQIATVQRLTAMLPQMKEPQQLKECCSRILLLHASTRERIALLDRLYKDIFTLCGTFETVYDIACGLNPFALPWMTLPKGCRYIPVDIDTRIISSINSLLVCLGRQPSAVSSDLFAFLPTIQADVVLLMKTLQNIEHQHKNSSQRLLACLQARHIVVTFPVRSLGGRQKGMEVSYESFMASLCASFPCTVRRLHYPEELVYVITK